ncbi:MAG TPA: hypothetical protein VJC12_02900 [Candidatus Paceibacterota bacterium]
MDPNNQNTNQTQENPKSIGPAIGIIIIIAIIVLGGLYFWNQRQKQNINPQTPASEDEVTNQLQAQSSSDELDSIDADAKATNFNSIGGEVDSAERAAAEDQ